MPVLAGSDVVVDWIDRETASVFCLTVTGISDFRVRSAGVVLDMVYPGHRLAYSKLYLGISAGRETPPQPVPMSRRTKNDA